MVSMGLDNFELHTSFTYDIKDVYDNSNAPWIKRVGLTLVTKTGN